MDSNSNYKNRALASLRGKWDKAALVAFLYSIIASFTNSPSYLFSFGASGETHWASWWSLLLYLAILPLGWGLWVYYLYFVRNEYLGMERLFDGYRAFKRIMLTKLLVAVYTFLWALLLIIPGIIKFYSYSMTDYILRDDPMLEYDAAIRRSMEMMEGHKMDLFGLHLIVLLDNGRNELHRTLNLFYFNFLNFRFFFLLNLCFLLLSQLCKLYIGLNGNVLFHGVLHDTFDGYEGSDCYSNSKHNENSHQVTFTSLLAQLISTV